jgi:hypothetical protein
MENTMITRNTTNPTHWDASPSMLPEMLPHLVEYVAEQGGTYIVTKDRNISVDDAMKQKKLVDHYALAARIQLSLHESASDIDDQVGYKSNMKEAAYQAGGYFRLYVRALGRNANPKVTSLISDYPSLKAFWDEGYLHEDRQLSRPYDD